MSDPTAFDDYVNDRLDEAMRAHPDPWARWLVDCRWCGKPLRTHGDDCVFDPDQCQFRGIETS